MTRFEVETRIGKPLRLEVGELVDGIRREEIEEAIYGAPGPLQGGYEVSVSYRGGRLISVGASEYDLAFYLCNSDKCPWRLENDRLQKLRSYLSDREATLTTAK